MDHGSSFFYYVCSELFGFATFRIIHIAIVPILFLL